MTEKKKFYIDYEMIVLLGFRPEDGVEYLESKKAIDMEPAHVMIHQLLKKKPVPSS